MTRPKPSWLDRVLFRSGGVVRKKTIERRVDYDFEVACRSCGHLKGFHIPVGEWTPPDTERTYECWGPTGEKDCGCRITGLEDQLFEQAAKG